MFKFLQNKGAVALYLVTFISFFIHLGVVSLTAQTLFKNYEEINHILVNESMKLLYVSPFLLFYPWFGVISDRISKTKLIRFISLFEIISSLLLLIAFMQGWFMFTIFLVFLKGLSLLALGPVRKGLIRELFGKNNLLVGNGWMQISKYTGVLLGMIVFIFLFHQMHADNLLYDTTIGKIPTLAEILQALVPVGYGVVGLSILMAIFSYRIPMVDAAHPDDDTKWFSKDVFKQQVKDVTNNRMIYVASRIFFSYFIIVHVVFAMFFPYFGTVSFDASINNNLLITLSNTIGLFFSVALLSRGNSDHIDLSMVPINAILYSVSIIILINSTTVEIAALAYFLYGFSGVNIAVPLFAIIQYNAPKERLGSVIMFSDMIIHLGMIVGLLIAIFFGYYELNLFVPLFFAACLSIYGAFRIIKLMPHMFARAILTLLVKTKYRLFVQHFENIPDREERGGKGLLLLGNHISYIDFCVIQLAFPRKIRFVMERGFYEIWYIKWFLKFADVIPISAGASKKSIAVIHEALKNGDVVCLFPEGAISHTGQLGEFKRGFERSLRDTGAKVVPFYIRGLWGSRFSRSSSKIRRNTNTKLKKRDLIISFGEPMDDTATAVQVKQKVFDLSISAWQEYTNQLEPIAHSFIDNAKRSGNDYAVKDSNADPLSYTRLLTATILFRKYIKPTKGDNIGLLLPTTSAGIIANISALMSGKTVVNLNYTASIDAMIAAKNAAGIQTIVTSSQFITKLSARGIDVTDLLEGCEILILEDLRGLIKTHHRIGALLTAKFLPAKWLKAFFCAPRKLDDTAAILFSSGSEGTPKGVMLTHRNIMANLKQISDVLNMRDDDVIMASLPLFHAFGLTVTGFMPVIEGIPVVCHPDPTDSVGIGKAIAKSKVTILLGTATFYRLYTRNKKVLPTMYDSLRLVVAGAEKMPKTTREAFEAKFHKTMLEGFGCTETTPVSSCNLPDELDTNYWTVQKGNKPGTVGLALPGTTYRIVDPVTLETLPTGESGLILIGGAQIMKGYLDNPEKTAEVICELDGIRFYKTGDKGYLDEDGFLTIVDRYSRFAKLSGEMVSLGDLEGRVREIIANDEIAIHATSLPDEKKGEVIILMIEGEYDLKALKKEMIKSSMSKLMIPTHLYCVEQLPILGSGKADFTKGRALAKQLLLG